MSQADLKRKIAMETIYGLSRSRYIESLGWQPFEWQSRVLQSRHKRKLINGARQSGKSTIVSAAPCHTAKYYPKSLSIIVAPTEAQAVEDIIKVKDFIAMDADYPKMIRSSQEEIALENGSRIIVIPATETAARGYSMPRTMVLDEASRIPDVVYQSGLRPMLTDNPNCELFIISTPNGKQGFFYEAYSSSTRWEQYEIRTPWEVDQTDAWNLQPYIDEEVYQEEMRRKGVMAWYSPRHYRLDEQLDQLEAMGMQLYRQEYCCEFVEQDDMVFSYDDIEAAFAAKIDGLDMPEILEIPAVIPPTTILGAANL